MMWLLIVCSALVGYIVSNEAVLLLVGQSRELMQTVKKTKIEYPGDVLSSRELQSTSTYNNGQAYSMEQIVVAKHTGVDRYHLRGAKPAKEEIHSRN